MIRKIITFLFLACAMTCLLNNYFFIFLHKGESELFETFLHLKYIIVSDPHHVGTSSILVNNPN